MNPFEEIRAAADSIIRECQLDSSNRLRQKFDARRYHRLRIAQSVMERQCASFPEATGEQYRMAVEEVRFRVRVLADLLIPESNTDPIYNVEKAGLAKISSLAMLILRMSVAANEDFKKGR
jgi:hypothetical protein